MAQTFAMAAPALTRAFTCTQATLPLLDSTRANDLQILPSLASVSCYTLPGMASFQELNIHIIRI